MKFLQDEQDDWLLEHFLQLKKRFEDYESFNKNSKLYAFEELEEILKKIQEYDNQESYFNNIIVKENILKTKLI